HSVSAANTSFDMHGSTMPQATELVRAQGLGFKHKVNSGTAPAYQLRIYGASNSSKNGLAKDNGYAALNWEPAYNTGTTLTPDADDWITVGDLENGQWWSTRDIRGLKSANNGGSTQSLAQIAFNNPNAVIVAYGVNLGSGAQASET